MQKFARNSMTLALSNISTAAVGFCLSLIVGRQLGATGFGRWTFCLAWASILTMICEFGINTLLTRDAARNRAGSNKYLMASLIAKSIFVTLVGGTVWLLAPVLGLDPETSQALRVTVLITVAGNIFGSLTAVFRAFTWMSPILWLNLLGGLVQLGWSSWILLSGGGVLALIWAAAVIDVAQSLGAGVLWWNRIKPQGGALSVSIYDALGMARGAIPFAVAGVLGAFQLRSSVLVLGYLRSEAELGWFGAASRFTEGAKLIPNGIFDAAFPVLASGGASDRANRFSFRSMSRFLFALVLLLAAILALSARPLLELSFGADFRGSAEVMIWLSVGLLPMFSNGTLETYLYATGDEVFATRLRAVSLLVQVLAAVPLIVLFGASGAAMSILLAEMAIWLPLRRRVALVGKGLLD